MTDKEVIIKEKDTQIRYGWVTTQKALAWLVLTTELETEDFDGNIKVMRAYVDSMEKQHTMLFG